MNLSKRRVVTFNDKVGNRIERILKTLCVDIGVRLAGSEGEKQAVEFVKEELTACGADVSVQQFPVLERRVEEEKLEARDLYLELITEVVPYTDQFPFAAARIPGAHLGRRNCTAGRFFHHRPDDNIDRVSTELLGDVIRVSTELLTELADEVSLPFSCTIPEDQHAQIQKYWKDLFGGWLDESRDSSSTS